jgi:hypothetical protein
MDGQARRARVCVQPRLQAARRRRTRQLPAGSLAPTEADGGDLSGGCPAAMRLAPERYPVGRAPDTLERARQTQHHSAHASAWHGRRCVLRVMLARTCAASFALSLWRWPCTAAARLLTLRLRGRTRGCLAMGLRARARGTHPPRMQGVQSTPQRAPAVRARLALPLDPRPAAEPTGPGAATWTPANAVNTPTTARHPAVCRRSRAKRRARRAVAAPRSSPTTSLRSRRRVRPPSERRSSVSSASAPNSHVRRTSASSRTRAAACPAQSSRPGGPGAA